LPGNESVIDYYFSEMTKTA